MGLFENLFTSTDENNNTTKINWIPLIESSQISEMIKQSSIKPALIFKHSTRCGVSRMALKGFEKEFDIDKSLIDLYFLDLLKFRSLSNEISEKLNVTHQSPQIILVKNSEVVYHDSHYSISVNKVKGSLNK
jgi:bacillithiol system protein YtxJ